MLRAITTVVMLFASNTFMNLAWYNHLKKPSWSVFVAIGVSWLIALPEYLLAVPANRIGSSDFGGPLSTPQLKIIQEAVTLVVFSLVTILVLKERVRATDYIAFGLVIAAVAISMLGRNFNI